RPLEHLSDQVGVGLAPGAADGHVDAVGIEPARVGGSQFLPFGDGAVRDLPAAGADEFVVGRYPRAVGAVVRHHHDPPPAGQGDEGRGSVAAAAGGGAAREWPWARVWRTEASGPARDPARQVATATHSTTKTTGGTRVAVWRPRGIVAVLPGRRSTSAPPRSGH